MKRRHALRRSEGPFEDESLRALRPERVEVLGEGASSPLVRQRADVALVRLAVRVLPRRPEAREGVKVTAGASERDIQTLVTGSRLWWSGPDLGAGVLESAFTASEAAAASLGFRRSAAEVHPSTPGGRAIVHERLGRPRRAKGFETCRVAQAGFRLAAG